MQLLCFPATDALIGSKTSTASSQDPVAEEIEVLGCVGIGVDRQQAACLHRGTYVHIPQVQSLRVGIDLQGRVMCKGRFDQGVQVRLQPGRQL